MTADHPATAALLARRLDVLAHDLEVLGRVARWTYVPVAWTGPARVELDRQLQHQEARLADVAGRIRERAALVRAWGAGES